MKKRISLRKVSALLLFFLLTVSASVGISFAKYAGAFSADNSSFQLTIKGSQPGYLASGNNWYRYSKYSSYCKTATNTISDWRYIKSVTFQPDRSTMPSSYDGYCVWDASAKHDESYMAYLKLSDKTITVYGNENGTILANPDSSYMFHIDNVSNIKYPTLYGLENIDTSNVTNMSWMFYSCHYGAINGIENWNVSKVTNMRYTFGYNYMPSLDLSKWDMSNVTNASEMFNYCISLKELDTSNWTLVNLRNAQGMFRNCNSIKVINAANWDTRNLTNTSSMFFRCFNLTTILATEKFDLSRVASSSVMFSSDENLVGGNGTKCDGINNIDAAYARIDKEGQPGYFTDINATQSLMYSATGDDETANGFGFATADIVS